MRCLLGAVLGGRLWSERWLGLVGGHLLRLTIGAASLRGRLRRRHIGIELWGVVTGGLRAAIGVRGRLGGLREMVGRLVPVGSSRVGGRSGVGVARILRRLRISLLRRVALRLLRRISGLRIELVGVIRLLSGIAGIGLLPMALGWLSLCSRDHPADRLVQERANLLVALDHWNETLAIPQTERRASGRIKL